MLVEKEDVRGEERRRMRDQGTALSGESTLNRMELGAAKLGAKERYKNKKILLDESAVDRMLVDIFLQAHSAAPKEIVLDLDSTDIPLHGEQEERFFHSYYGITAICRCTSCVASMCCARACGRPIVKHGYCVAQY